MLHDAAVSVCAPGPQNAEHVSRVPAAYSIHHSLFHTRFTLVLVGSTLVQCPYNVVAAAGCNCITNFKTANIVFCTATSVAVTFIHRSCSASPKTINYVFNTVISVALTLLQVELHRQPQDTEEEDEDDDEEDEEGGGQGSTAKRGRSSRTKAIQLKLSRAAVENQERALLLSNVEVPHTRGRGWGGGGVTKDEGGAFARVAAQSTQGLCAPQDCQGAAKEKERKEKCVPANKPRALRNSSLSSKLGAACLPCFPHELLLPKLWIAAYEVTLLLLSQPHPAFALLPMCNSSGALRSQGGTPGFQAEHHAQSAAGSIY
eukprot:1161954-Pelagomonas_calceolata.AAC.1